MVKKLKNLKQKKEEKKINKQSAFDKKTIKIKEKKA